MHGGLAATLRRERRSAGALRPSLPSAGAAAMARAAAAGPRRGGGGGGGAGASVSERGRGAHERGDVALPPHLDAALDGADNARPPWSVLDAVLVEV